MAALSAIKGIAAILRARLREESLPPDFPDQLRQSTKRDVAWVRTTSRHRIAPALGACLEDLDLETALPAELALYFRSMQDGNNDKNQIFRDELAEIVQTLNALDIEPCLIKGAGALVDPLYPNDAWRFMNDLDLLLPNDEMKAAWDALCAMGYRQYVGGVDSKEDHHHYPPLWHPEKMAYVELHHRFARPRYDRILPVKEALDHAHHHDISNVGRISLPCAEDRAILLIAHAQIFNCYDQYGLFRFTDLVELDRLEANHQLDLNEVADRFQHEGWGRQCATFLALAEGLLETPVPAEPKTSKKAKIAAKRLILAQTCRPLRMVHIIAGWLLRTLQHAWLDGDWRQTYPRLAKSAAGKMHAPFYSLRKLLQDYA